LPANQGKQIMSTGKTLLLIDDDQDDLEMLQMQLKKIDSALQIYTAIDGVDALETLQHKMILEPDLIFLDINMPIMDGKQFLKEIKKDSKLRHIPVIIYSTSKSQADIDETSKLGASSYLSKPNNHLELRNSLTGILQAFA
jgi:CheY-like chemotaxis protein